MADELETAPELTITEAPEPEPETPPVEAAPKEKIRKVIQPMAEDGKTPLGAAHIYEGDTLEEVNAKMAEAIAHGTRKIHELSRQAKLETPKAPDGAEVDVEAPVWKPRELTDEEKFLIKSDPTQAFDISFKAKFGMPVEEFAARQNKRDEDAQVTREKAETDIFKDNHPEFLACDENRDAMIAYMHKHSLKWRAKNLDIAFRELSESGLLKLRPEEAPVTPAEEVRTEPVKRAAQPEFPAVIRNNTSRATAPIRTNSGKLTPEQFNELSADELRKMYPELRDAR